VVRERKVILLRSNTNPRRNGCCPFHNIFCYNHPRPLISRDAHIPNLCDLSAEEGTLLLLELSLLAIFAGSYTLPFLSTASRLFSD
jgi:hypothetical protein